MSEHEDTTPPANVERPSAPGPGRDLEEDRRQLGRDGLANLPDAEAPGASVSDEDAWAAVEPNEPG